MSLQRCSVRDLMQDALSERKITPEGFLVAPAKLSRAGNVQAYSAGELGLTDKGMARDKIVRLYRPRDEVAHPDALKSFDNQTVTMGHPPDGVNAANWKGVACGDCRGVGMDGDYMTGVLTIRDADAVRDVIDGTRQMSCGYDFDLDMTPGMTPDGQAHDGIMRNLRGNHHAIVDAARGGPGCRVADRQPNKETQMATVRMMIDSLNVELADDQSASIVKRALDTSAAALKTSQDAATAATTRATDAETKLAAAEKAKADLIVAHDAKVKELTGKILTQDQLDAIGAERASLIADALVLVPEFKIDGKTNQAARLELVTAAGADEALKPTVEAMLSASGEKDPAKASDSALRMVVAALVPMKKTGATSAGDDDGTRARDAALAGGDSSGTAKPAKLVGRALMMAVDMLRSSGQREAGDKMLREANQ